MTQKQIDEAADALNEAINELKKKTPKPTATVEAKAAEGESAGKTTLTVTPGEGHALAPGDKVFVKLPGTDTFTEYTVDASNLDDDGNFVLDLGNEVGAGDIVIKTKDNGYPESEETSVAYAPDTTNADTALANVPASVGDKTADELTNPLEKDIANKRDALKDLLKEDGTPKDGVTQKELDDATKALEDAIAAKEEFDNRPENRAQKAVDEYVDKIVDTVGEPTGSREDADNAVNNLPDDHPLKKPLNDVINAADKVGIVKDKKQAETVTVQDIIDAQKAIDAITDASQKHNKEKLQEKLNNLKDGLVIWFVDCIGTDQSSDNGEAAKEAVTQDLVTRQAADLTLKDPSLSGELDPADDDYYLVKLPYQFHGTFDDWEIPVHRPQNQCIKVQGIADYADEMRTDYTPQNVAVLVSDAYTNDEPAQKYDKKVNQDELRALNKLIGDMQSKPGEYQKPEEHYITVELVPPAARNNTINLDGMASEHQGVLENFLLDFEAVPLIEGEDYRYAAQLVAQNLNEKWQLTAGMENYRIQVLKEENLHLDIEGNVIFGQRLVTDHFLEDGTIENRKVLIVAFELFYNDESVAMVELELPFMNPESDDTSDDEGDDESSELTAEKIAELENKVYDLVEQLNNEIFSGAASVDTSITNGILEQLPEDNELRITIGKYLAAVEEMQIVLSSDPVDPERIAVVKGNVEALTAQLEEGYLLDFMKALRTTLLERLAQVEQSVGDDDTEIEETEEAKAARIAAEKEAGKGIADSMMNAFDAQTYAEDSANFMQTVEELGTEHAMYQELKNLDAAIQAVLTLQSETTQENKAAAESVLAMINTEELNSIYTTLSDIVAQTDITSDDEESDDGDGSDNVGGAGEPGGYRIGIYRMLGNSRSTKLEVKVPFLILPRFKDNEKYEPKLPAKTAVNDPSDLTDAEKIEVWTKLREANQVGLPSDVIITIADDGTATITYSDKSTDTIKGTDLVYKKSDPDPTPDPDPKPDPEPETDPEDTTSMADRFDPNPASPRVPVRNKDRLSAEERGRVAAAIREANPDLPSGTEIRISDDGTATIVYPDGSEDVIAGELNVVQIEYSGIYIPPIRLPGDTAVDSQTKQTIPAEKKVDSATAPGAPTVVTPIPATGEDVRVPMTMGFGLLALAVALLIYKKRR